MNPLNPKDKRVVLTNIIVIFLLAGVLFTLINLIGDVEREGFQCMGDPLGYGAEKLSEVNNAELSCTCTLAKPNSPILFFDSTSKEIMYPEVRQSGNDFIFNLSEIVVAE